MQPTGSAAGYSTISIAKGTPDVKVPEGGKVRLVHPDGSHKYGAKFATQILLSLQYFLPF